MRRSIIIGLLVASVASMGRAETRHKSDACLACHNGTKAAQMESSHPYSVDYAKAVAQSKSKYRNAQSPSGFGATIADDLLVNGSIECSTCHVSHEAESDNQFRLRSRDVVKLCTACHVMR